MKACKRNGMKLGVWGFVPGNILEFTPLRTLENALLQNRIEIILIIALYAEKEK